MLLSEKGQGRWHRKRFTRRWIICTQNPENILIYNYIYIYQFICIYDKSKVFGIMYWANGIAQIRMPMWNQSIPHIVGKRKTSKVFVRDEWMWNSCWLLDLVFGCLQGQPASQSIIIIYIVICESAFRFD